MCTQRTCQKGDRSHCLLNCDLSDGSEVVVSVVGHDYPTEENGHDARELETLSKKVRTKGKEKPHGKLQ